MKDDDLMRRSASPLLIRDGELVVHGRNGKVVTLPMTGDGAVAALAPYRFSQSRTATQVERGTRRTGTSRYAVVHTGRRFVFAKEYTLEHGVAMLDHRGAVLLRVRGLPQRKLRRFAADHGLPYRDEKLTDPEVLRAAPELVTGRYAQLPSWTHKIAERSGFVVGASVFLGEIRL